MLGGLLVLVVGGFVLWLQAGLLYAIGSLALGLVAAVAGIALGRAL